MRRRRRKRRVKGRRGRKGEGGRFRKDIHGEKKEKWM